MRKLQKTEVRIGNYFVFVDSFDCRENDDINQISESDFEESSDSWDRKLPLKLTDNFLLKNGFSQYGTLFESEKISLTQTKNGYCLSEGTEYLIGNEFQFVHQFQNLYFALNLSEFIFSTEP